MTDGREKMLDKIRALLSKTTENGCTQEEELAALAKARAWMDAYDVTEADLQLAKDEGIILRKGSSDDPHNIKYYMIAALQVLRLSGLGVIATGRLCSLDCKVTYDLQRGCWII